MDVHAQANEVVRDEAVEQGAQDVLMRRGERRFQAEQRVSGDRGRGNFDPAQFREQMNQRMRERLGASEEEWKVLQPRIEKVQTAQRALSSRCI